MIARLVSTALGVWLIAAPAVLGYADSHPVASGNDRIVGPLVASAAIVALWPELRPVRWVNLVLGGWLAVAAIVFPLFTDHPLAASVDGIVVGLALVLLARVRGTIDDDFGGGWRSIWRDDIDTTDPEAVQR